MYAIAKDAEMVEEGVWQFPKQGLCRLNENSYQILVGSEIDRTRLGEADKTIFISVDEFASQIRTGKEVIVGIRGWALCMEEIFRQYRQLCLINESNLMREVIKYKS